MRRVLSLDRLPVLALMCLILVGWAGAAYYVPRMGVAEISPFTKVWARYDAPRIAQLVAWCGLGLLGAIVVPIGGAVPLHEVGHRMSELVNRLRSLWVGLAGVGLLYLVAVKGPYLLYAPEYLAFVVPSPLVSIANLLAPITAVAAGVASRRRPFFGYAVIVLLAGVLFAYATRMFAGLAALFLVGRILGGARVRWPACVIAAIYTLVALPVPLANRMNATHGLIPYASATWSSLSEGRFLQSSLLIGAENVGFSAPLLNYVADEVRITPADLAISVNPLPASMAGWNGIADSMRVHYYIPYSMLGELANIGGPLLALGLFVWGFVVRASLISVFRQDNPLMPFFVTAVLGLAFISTTYIVQYNTRSVARLVWVILGIVAVEALFRSFWRSRQWLLSLSDTGPGREHADTRLTPTPSEGS